MSKTSIQKYHNTTNEFTHAQRLYIAYLRWLGGHSKHWNINVCWHVPEAMRRYYGGYNADWLAKELTRYFNKVDRRIYKAAYTNRGLRLQRIITLEYDDAVGWHAHGILECALGMDEEQTLTLLQKMWRQHTARFSKAKFEKHEFWGETDNGFYLPYILKRVHRQNKTTLGILDTKNTYFLDN